MIEKPNGTCYDLVVIIACCLEDGDTLHQEALRKAAFENTEEKGKGDGSMIQVAICDDEKRICEELSEYLRSLQAAVDEKLEIDCFQSVEEIQAVIREECNYHIIFMDIRLGRSRRAEIGCQDGRQEDNGIQAAIQIKERFPAVLIIFVTGYEQYVYDSFAAQPVGFIKKPIKQREVKEVFERAVKQCDSAPVWEYKAERALHRVPLGSICAFYSDKRKVVLQVGMQKQSYYGKLDEVEEKLERCSNHFVRINKSYIINLHYVRKIGYDAVTIGYKDHDWEYSISPPYRAHVREWCMKYWRKARE